MNYRITAARHDINEHNIHLFVASTDQEALLMFERYKGMEQYKWDRLLLIRVDQVEKTTTLASRD